jgi:hemerythrin superfamily protein
MSVPVSELIRMDHREMERLFNELKDSRKRLLVAPTVVALLTAHSRAEESEVYPIVRTETNASDEVEHSQEEHVEADHLASQLAQMDVNDSRYEGVLEDLVEAVSHHIGEEEESVLPALETLPRQQQEAAGAAFARVRAQYLSAGAATLTRDELQQQARNEGKTGTSGMTKEELAQAVES